LSVAESRWVPRSDGQLWRREDGVGRAFADVAAINRPRATLCGTTGSTAQERF
jgi:hypothetical protein